MATSFVTMPSPLAIARKPFGYAVFASSPFKPISQNLSLFFAALLSAIPVAKSNTLQTHTRLDVFADKPTDEPVAAETAECAQSTDATPVPLDTKPSVEHVSVPENENPATTEQIASSQEETISAEDIVAPAEGVSPIVDAMPDTESVMAASPPVTDNLAILGITSTEEATAAEATEEVSVIAWDEASSDTEDLAMDEEHNPSEASFTTAVESSESATTTDHIFESPVADDGAIDEPAENPAEHIAPVYTKPYFEIDSESDIKAVIQDILDNNNDLYFETDFENDFENDSAGMDPENAVNENTVENDAKAEPAAITMPTPVYPLIFEDDFDAAISSIFATEFEILMGIDVAWSIPQVVEKGKSQRGIVRERLADHFTAQTDRQNSRLEKAARALTIGGAAPAPAVNKAAVPAVEDMKPAVPVESDKEAEIPVHAEDKIEDALFPETEEDVVELAKRMATRGSHSRTSSSSSAGSKLSVEGVFDSAPCPGTPATEYAATPTRVSQDFTTLQQAPEGNENKAAGIPSQAKDIVASYPVPGAEYRNYDLTYAVFSDGRIAYHYPEGCLVRSFTRADYDQYMAAHPDGPKMNPIFLTDYYDDDAYDAASDTSSEFVSEPNDEGERPGVRPSTPPPTTDGEDHDMGDNITSPYVRPSNPEPTTPCHHTAHNSNSNQPGHTYRLTLQPSASSTFSSQVNREGSDLEDEPSTPSPPSKTHRQPTTPHQPPPEQDEEEDFWEEDLDLPYPISPYRTRATPDSWTGLETDAWGIESYLDLSTGTMGVRRVWQAESGVAHGLLQRCEWVCRQTKPVPAVAVGDGGGGGEGVPELKVTTVEGEEFWLEEEDGSFSSSRQGDDEGVYGHWCGEGCVGFYARFGWDLFPEAQDVYPVALPPLDEGGKELEQDEQVEKYWWIRLETILEEDEDEVSEVGDVDEVVDESLLDRLADAVLEEAEMTGAFTVVMGQNRMALERTYVDERKEAAEKELPMWMKDPTYVSNMSWADMVDEDEEY
ncbi:hypothetical protein C8A00DRAFT_34619 [Chaetomidium leptoderma]|uniref:Uncharacterized protein n=1 Tax=Chaetomidium leptoderma TaxID=669021 RepID=A0AAN6VJI6_9PEZI|nr:hypothetical protein C8A00DRAFT_34619 [Chaetomidium leptoderma]